MEVTDVLCDISGLFEIKVSKRLDVGKGEASTKLGVNDVKTRHKVGRSVR